MPDAALEPAQNAWVQAVVGELRQLWAVKADDRAWEGLTRELRVYARYRQDIFGPRPPNGPQTVWDGEDPAYEASRSARRKGDARVESAGAAALGRLRGELSDAREARDLADRRATPPDAWRALRGAADQLEAALDTLGVVWPTWPRGRPLLSDEAWAAGRALTGALDELCGAREDLKLIRAWTWLSPVELLGSRQAALGDRRDGALEGVLGDAAAATIAELVALLEARDRAQDLRVARLRVEYAAPDQEQADRSELEDTVGWTRAMLDIDGPVAELAARRLTELGRMVDQARVFRLEAAIAEEQERQAERAQAAAELGAWAVEGLAPANDLAKIRSEAAELIRTAIIDGGDEGFGAPEMITRVPSSKSFWERTWPEVGWAPAGRMLANALATHWEFAGKGLDIHTQTLTTKLVPGQQAAGRLARARAEMHRMAALQRLLRARLDELEASRAAREDESALIEWRAELLAVQRLGEQEQGQEIKVEGVHVAGWAEVSLGGEGPGLAFGRYAWPVPGHRFDRALSRRDALQRAWSADLGAQAELLAVARRIVEVGRSGIDAEQGALGNALDRARLLEQNARDRRRSAEKTASSARAALAALRRAADAGSQAQAWSERVNPGRAWQVLRDDLPWAIQSPAPTRSLPLALPWNDSPFHEFDLPSNQRWTGVVFAAQENQIGVLDPGDLSPICRVIPRDPDGLVSAMTRGFEPMAPSQNGPFQVRMERAIEVTRPGHYHLVFGALGPARLLVNGDIVLVENAFLTTINLPPGDVLLQIDYLHLPGRPVGFTLLLMDGSTQAVLWSTTMDEAMDWNYVDGYQWGPDGLVFAKDAWEVLDAR